MAQKTVSPIETVRFDSFRVIRLTALSFIFVALLSVYGSDSQPASPAASGASSSHSRTLISEQ